MRETKKLTTEQIKFLQKVDAAQNDEEGECAEFYHGWGDMIATLIDSGFYESEDMEMINDIIGKWKGYKWKL